MKPRVVESQSAGGVRAALIAHYEAWANRLGGDPFGKLRPLRDGRPVVLSHWQIPEPWRSGAPGDTNTNVRVDPDGTLTAVRPIIAIDPNGVRHQRAWAPLGPGGDASEILVEWASQAVDPRALDESPPTTAKSAPRRRAHS